jgi:hypothetical protein
MGSFEHYFSEDDTCNRIKGSLKLSLLSGLLPRRLFSRLQGAPI